MVARIIRDLGLWIDMANFLEGFGHRILALLVFCPDIAREITWNSGMQLRLLLVAAKGSGERLLKR